VNNTPILLLWPVCYLRTQATLLVYVSGGIYVICAGMALSVSCCTIEDRSLIVQICSASYAVPEAFRLLLLMLVTTRKGQRWIRAFEMVKYMSTNNTGME